MRKWIFSLSLLFMSLPAIAAAPEVPTEEFLSQVFETIKRFGGMPWTLKVASVVLIVIASMKVSFLRPAWDRLGKFKAFAAPALSLVAGVLSLGVAGHLSVAGVSAYLFAGAGAIVLHELLDAVKALPGLSAVYVAAIGLIQGFLKRPVLAVSADPQPPKDAGQ